MGKAWDGSKIAYDVALWREALRVLKPGGHLLAFGGTRTWHRLAVAVEDAGFEIRDSIAWMYGSGFPKSLDVSKGIDKLDATAERRARALEFTAWMRSTGITRKVMATATGTASVTNHYLETTAQPSIATADLFDLLRPHLPAVPERIEELVRLRTVESENIKARAILSERPAFGIGGNGILGGHADGATARTLGESVNAAAQQWQGWGTALKPAFEPIVMARKPLIGTVAANVQAHGTGALNIDATRIGTTDTPAGSGGGRAKRLDGDERTDKGAGMYSAGDGAGYTPSPAGRWPANVALDEHMAAVLDGQSGVLKTGGGVRNNTNGPNVIGLGLGPIINVSHSDSGGASRFFYVAKAPKKERPVVDEVAHATVKPLALMRWLVRLVTPEGGTVLEPFAGSGTTVEACILEGFHCIAIEQEAEYLPLIQARIDRQEVA